MEEKFNNLKAQEQMMASKKAKEAMNNMKYEIASELGINLKNGYNGDLTSKQAGYIGGYMVKKMIQDTQKNMK